MTAKETTKEQAMANYLGDDAVELQTGHDENNFICGSNEYMILTDEEADEMATQYIKDSLWAFNASFIVEQCSLDSSLIDIIGSWQGDKCEDANEGLESLIENSCGIDEFIESAISEDGRGHFMSSYDGKEIERDDYYIYRIN